jgi:heptosyltransferase III
MITASALIYHTGGLGDFITTIPALRFWKARHENEQLVLLGKVSIGIFAQEIGLIDGMLDVDGAQIAPLFSEYFSSAAEKILPPFLTAILFAAQDSPIINAVRRRGIPSAYLQPPFPAAEDKIHIIDYHLSLFTDPQSLDSAKKIPHVTPSEIALKKSLTLVPEHLSPVAIHPGSGSRKKNWPFERFLSLADVLRKKGIPFLWLLGPADDGFTLPSVDIVVSNQPLTLCAALLSRCRTFIGSDSGMAHLAAAVACPSIVLFGPSDPAVWSPRGKNVSIFYTHKSCSPCHRSATVPLSCDNSCMAEITVEDVVNEIGRFISPAKAEKAGRTCAQRKGRSCPQDSR